MRKALKDGVLLLAFAVGMAGLTVQPPLIVALALVVVMASVAVAFLTEDNPADPDLTDLVEFCRTPRMWRELVERYGKNRASRLLRRARARGLVTQDFNGGPWRATLASADHVGSSPAHRLVIRIRLLLLRHKK